MTGDEESNGYIEIDYDQLQEVVEGALTQYSERPFLETAFEDYTVGEGLLLLILLTIIVIAVLRFIGRCFSWLR